MAPFPLNARILFFKASWPARPAVRRVGVFFKATFKDQPGYDLREGETPKRRWHTILPPGEHGGGGGSYVSPAVIPNTSMAISFTGQFHVEHDEALTPEYARRFAEMVGAPDGSRVIIGDAKRLEWGETGEIAALLYHLYIKHYAIRVFADAANGEKIIRNEVLERTANAPAGFVLRLFARQVEAATRYGYARILTYAAGKPDGHMNGYYTWPRLGYNGAFSAEEKTRLPNTFRSARTVQDIMATPEGRQWWKANGWAKELIFDLRPGSRSHQVLMKYLAERRIE